MKKRGQFSVEYMMVIAFALGTIMTISFILYMQTQQATGEEAVTKIEIMANDILATAGRVYHAGEISKKTLRYPMPAIVNNVYVSGDNSLVFNVSEGGATYVLAYYSDTPIQGFFPSDPINTNKISHFIVQNRGDHVLICSEEYGCS